MAMAPASGIRPSAIIRKLCATACAALRLTWALSLRVRNTVSPVRGRISTEQIASEPSARNSSTSLTG